MAIGAIKTFGPLPTFAGRAAAALHLAKADLCILRSEAEPFWIKSAGWSCRPTKGLGRTPV